MSNSRVESQEVYDAREAYNKVALDRVRQQATRKLGNKAKLQAVYLEQLFVGINQTLHEQNVYLSMQAGIDALAVIVMGQVIAHIEHPKKEDLQTNLNNWVQRYRQLEKQKYADNSNPSIANSLINGGANPDTAWGDHTDLGLILKGLITDPSAEGVKIQSNQTYILSPASIVVGKEEARITNPILTLKDKIQEVMDKCGDQTNVKVCIPVNNGQSHWQLLSVTVNAAQITSAELVDSLKNKRLKKQPAYKTAQAVVDQINPENKVVVTAKATGKQLDGFRCIDYVAQAAVQQLPVVENPTLVTLRDATNGRALRTAVIGRILEAHPAIQQNHQRAVEQAEVLHAKAQNVLKPSVDEAHEQLKNLQGDEKKIQVDFDSLLAAKLQELDDSSFNVAWDYARKSLLAKYSMFKPATKEEANLSETLDASVKPSAA
jgi:hypothetical protein